MRHVITIPPLTERDLARFWRRVRKGEGDECWEWTGSHKPAGYGVIYIAGHQLHTHRVSWAIHNGPIPDGKLICHHCDNPPCIRPDHLFAGTSSDNTQDAVRKGKLGRKSVFTGYQGTRNAMAKLTDDQVREIRRRYSRGNVTHAVLAAEFGVTRPHVSGIVRRKFWPWLPDDDGNLAKPSDENADAYISIAKAGEMLGLSRNLVAKLITTGRFSARYSESDSRYKLIPRVQVEEYGRSLRKASVLWLLVRYAQPQE